MKDLLKNGIQDLQGGNPLDYKGIRRKTEELTGKDRALRSSCNRKSKIDGRDVIGVCDGRFLMASMG